MAAEPVSSLVGPSEDDTSGMSAHGELVGIDPSTAASAFPVRWRRRAQGTGDDDIESESSDTAVDSHPVVLTCTNPSLGVELDDEQWDDVPMSAVGAVGRTVVVRLGQLRSLNDLV